MTDYQIREVDMLVDLIMNFSMSEMLHFETKLNNKIYNTASININNVTNAIFRNDNINEFKKTVKPYHNPNHLLEQDVLASLVPFLASGYLTRGSGSASGEEGKLSYTLDFINILGGSEVKKEAKAEEKKAEPVKEVIILLIK